FHRFSEPAFRRHHFQFLFTLDGRVSVYYGADHFAIVDSHYPFASEADGRESARGSPVDGKVDVLSCRADGDAFRDRADQYLQFACLATDPPIRVHCGSMAAFRDYLAGNDRWDDVRHLARRIDLR